MSITALFFIAIFVFLSLSSFLLGPFWGLCNYIFVYFISPNPQINWWAADMPNLRWSLIAAFITILSIFLHKDKLSEKKVVTSTIWKLLLIFILLTFIISINAVDVTRNYDRCYDLIRYLIVYFMFLKVIKTENDFMKIILLIVACGVLLGYFAYTTPRAGARLEGIGPPDAADANSLAILFAGILPFILPVFYYGANYFKIIAALAAAFISNGIILCNSRGGLISVVSSITVGTLLIRDKKLRKRIIILVVILAGTFLYLADTNFLERTGTIRTSIETEGGTGRFDIWRYGLQMAADHPFGIGGGGFEALSRQYMPPELLTRGSVRASHNTYLLILVEQGIIGLIIYLFILSKLFLTLLRTHQFLNIKTADSDEGNIGILRKLIVLSLIVSLSSYVIGAIVSEKIYYEYFFYLAALISIYNVDFISSKTKEIVISS